MQTVQALLFTAGRNDGDNDNLRSSAYEALNVVLLYAPDSHLPTMETIAIQIIERLEKTFSTELLSQDDINAQVELQGLLCGVLQVEDYCKIFIASGHYATRRRENPSSCRQNYQSSFPFV